MQSVSSLVLSGETAKVPRAEGLHTITSGYAKWNANRGALVALAEMSVFGLATEIGSLHPPV